MANNYTPSYNQYRTQTAGYALPSSVRTYSVFDPASNSWRRMTNDGMSPMPQGNQPDIQAALAQARQTQGTVYPAQGMGQGQPVEVHPGYLNPPAQMPSRGSRTPSQPLPRGGAVPVQGQPVNEAVTLTGPSTDARGISLNPNLNYPFRSNFENFQQEIPRSTAYGPLQNPRVVRNMSPDYQEASAATPTIVQQATVQQPMRPLAVAPGVSNAEVVQPVVKDIFDSDEFLNNAHRSGKYDAAINEFTRHLGQMANASAMFAPNALYNAGWQVNRGLAGLVKQSPTMNRYISPLLNRINTTSVGQGATRLRNVRTPK